MTCRRNSSIELLRLLLMFLIVLGHCIIHGLGLYGISPYSHGTINHIPDSQILFAMIIYCFCTYAVNCFILISGYFGINLSKKKFLSLLFALIFYSIFFNVLPEIIAGNLQNAILNALFLSHSPYWFIIDYLFLMVFAPLLNSSFKILTTRYCCILVIMMGIAPCYFGFLWSHPVNTNGYTLFQFIMIYCIGRLIRKTEFNIRKNKAIILFLVGCVTTGALMYIVYSSPLTNYTWRMSYYNNPLVIFNAIMLFYIFLNITIHSKFINSLASSALAIYLIQSSQWVSNIMYENIAIKSAKIGGIWLYINILSLAIIIFSLLFDKIRIYLSSRFINIG